MISTDFLGGLGNNLFQLANVYSIHKKFGYDYVIPKFANRGDIGRYGQSTTLELDQLFETDFNYGNNLNLKKYNHIDLNPTNTDFSYVPFKIEDNTNYVGYFQSEKYFLGIDISKHFILKKRNILEIKNRYSSFFSKKNISLHYRLGGDRTEKRMQHFHKNVSISFYEKALNSIVDYNEENFNILVFTDNIEMCKNLLSNFGKNLFFIDNSNNNILDFTFMSMCDVNIIGNSTFSWWSAYLNLNNEKSTVIVPETEWYGPGYNNFTKKDLFLDKWIKI